VSAHDLPIEAFMCKNMVTIDVAATVGQAARQLAAHMMSCLIVLEHGQPAGMLTERDIAVCAAAGHELEALVVGEIMGRPLVSVYSRESLASVVRRLVDQGIRHAPVLDHVGALVGLVTQSDLLHACAEQAGILPPRV